MDNATRILCCLDYHLDHEVRLILYGRAAIQLGFPGAPEAVARSLDVDAIIPVGQVETLAADQGFWDAQEAANRELEPSGLYITHLFPSDMVILRADWLDHLVPLEKPATRHLKLFRPATVDLVLTKMMRGADPQDLEDAAFLCRQDRLSRSALESAFDQAVIPDFPEILESFKTCRPKVLDVAIC
ncbi:MAG: hypothetical protein RIS24_2159 [Verrucomicrobiota bacterium]